MSAQVDAIVARLEGVKRTGEGQWMAKCPGHDDRQASLSVRRGDDGRVLLNCHAGCDTENIVENLEMSMSDLFPPRADGKPAIVATYEYRDEAGKLLYEVVRTWPKGFRQRRPAEGGGWEWKLEGTRRVLYRLQEILAAKPGTIVWICEGEKDADRLRAMGMAATTNAQGAGKWLPEYTASLKDRTVVILPDNDEPGRKHAIDVATALTNVAKSVKVLALPGLPAKGDVSDWVTAGGTGPTLVELAARAPFGVPKPHSFQPAIARIAGERQQRVANSRGILTFGVKFLDEAFGGITHSDLILFGAKSGVGKTSLATIVSLANCQRGKRVHYFALEAEEREIERRMKFQLVAEIYYSTGVHRPPIRFQDWYNGLLDDELSGFESEADERLERVLANLYTYYRTDRFTSDDFREQFNAIVPETDLVVLDHFHYIDEDDKDENKSAKKTVKQIRDCVLLAKKPVIIVAHVRKSDRRNDTLVPMLEDFHGSSDIPKIATKAVMIASAYDVAPPTPFLWPTYVMAAKNRTDMAVTRYASLIHFNTRQNNYTDEYQIGRLTDAGKAFSELPIADFPSWAKSAQHADDEEVAA